MKKIMPGPTSLSRVKVYIFSGLIIATASIAKQHPNIKVDTFIGHRDSHSIHKINSVTVLSKVEGNKTCLIEEEGVCHLWAMLDKITLSIAGSAEANLGGYNKILARDVLLTNDYASGKSITRLELKGARFNAAETLVYDNVGWPQWSGGAPFEFKIEINNDINKESEEKEFRIPLSNSSVFRFKVTYANAKWSVDTLPSLSTSYSLTGELAQKLFDLGVSRPGSTNAHYEIACLKVGALDPACFTKDFDTGTKIDSKISKDFYQVVKSKFEIFKDHLNFSINCETPSEWSRVKETTCKISEIN